MLTGAYSPVEEMSGINDRIKGKTVDADQEHTTQTSKQLAATY